MGIPDAKKIKRGRSMKQRALVILLGALLVVSLLSGCSQPEAPTQYLNIATGGTAGTYYPLGGAMAEIWNKNVKGVNATAQSTGASVANVNLLKENKADIIMVQNDIVYYAANGIEMFKDNQYADVRGIATLYTEPIQIVAKSNTKIKNLDDLKGKKVSVGPIGSGSEVNARQILAAAGITYADFNPQYLSLADASSNIKDGNIDAMIFTAAYPTAAIQDLNAQHEIQMIPIEDAVADALIAQYPFYTKIVIPAETYQGINYATKGVAVKAMLVVSSAMSEDLVYQLLKTMYENTDRIIAAHKVGEHITRETGSEGIPIPMHPGAEKYFSGK